MTNSYAFAWFSAFQTVTSRTILHLMALICLVLCATTTHAASHKKQDPVGSVPGACDAGKAKRHFTVDISGNASYTGRTYEGPLCIEIASNPVVQFTQIEAVAGAPVKGPDPSSVFTGGSPSGGGKKLPPDREIKGPTLPEKVQQLMSQVDPHNEKGLKVAVDGVKQAYNRALQDENTAIDELTRMNKAMHTVDVDSAPTALKSQYKALKSDLTVALAAPTSFVPTDAANPATGGEVYLAEVQALEDELANLPLEFVTGTAKPASATQCIPAANATPVDSNWTDWIAVCKDAVYTTLKQNLDALLTESQGLTASSDALSAFKKQASIVTYWDGILTNIGLTTTMADEDIPKAPLVGFLTHVDVPCDGLFNASVPTALNLVTLDYTPTLIGGDPTQKAQSAFVTVNCSTRFSISGGVGFSTIEQKTFAILPSSDGKGGTTNTFGTTSDSKITPVALAVTNIRLAEWANHGVGLHGSLGIGGNLQTNASAAYFLPGISLAFWRTMYLTAGAGIGSQSVLTGGYRVGDPVPTGVTTIGAVTGSSHTAGFSFAITFTKP
jgi:hypothetical protein